MILLGILSFRKFNDSVIDFNWIDLTIGRDGVVYFLCESNGHYEIRKFTSNSFSSQFLSLNENIHFLRVIGDGYLLITNNSSPSRPNAFIYNQNLERLNSFYVGTDINCCLVDSEDRIWIGYGDEGIFSGEQLEQNGLNCFNSDGEIMYNDFHINVESGLITPIDTCYALYAQNDSIWIAYYSSENMLVHLDKEFNLTHRFSIAHLTLENMLVNVNNAFFISKKRLYSFHLLEKKLFELTLTDEHLIELHIQHIFTSENKIWVLSNQNLYVHYLD